VEPLQSSSDAISSRHVGITHALASYAKEGSEALCELISRASDGVFDQRDAEAALKEVDEALRAHMSIRALAVAVVDKGRAAA
jgi:hypothetical protein